MIVGTAGHIDHGKTALVRALTGTDADRLKEERTRGITIDLGFAYADLGAGSIGFVDVPGHERLIHTMVAGAGGIDMVLLVVAATEGIMPQTREHLAILDLLGVGRGVVALTKADLADDDRIAMVTAEVRAALASTALEDASILPVSSLTGAGMDELRAALLATQADVAARSDAGRLRVVLDRSFTLQGAGTVVTGTVVSGRIAEGAEVALSPSGLRTRVRGLRVQNRPAAEGQAGQRVALNLAGVAKDAVHRGDVVLAPGDHAPTARVDARLRWLGAKPLVSGLRARLHIGAAEAGGRVVTLADDLVQMVLDRPLALSWGERFILRDVSARETLGGGCLLDLRPPARKRATPERLAQLDAEHDDPVAALHAKLDRSPFMLDLDAFLRDRALTAVDLSGIVDIADGEGRVAMLAGRHVALREALLATLDAFHTDNPELQGMARERLRLMLTPRLPKDAFATLLREMAGGGSIRLDSGFVRLASHEVRLAPEDAALWAQAAPELGGEARFRPPRVRDLATQFGADEREMRRVLKLAARMGWVDQVAHDHFFLRETVAHMVDILQDVAAQAEDGWITAAAFRDRMDNGRKVAIQILDFYDRQGVTLRRGDLRRINPHRADLFGPAPATEAQGREASPVGRPDFKSGCGSEPVAGGFDSRSLPPAG